MKSRIALVLSLLIIIVILLRDCQAPADLLDAAKEYDAMATLEFKMNTPLIKGVKEIEFVFIPRVSSKRFDTRLYFPLITGDTIDYYFKDLEKGILPFINGMDFSIYNKKGELVYHYKYKLKDRIAGQNRPSAGITLGSDFTLKKNKLYRIKLTIPDNNISDEKLSKGQLIIGLGWSFAYL